MSMEIIYANNCTSRGIAIAPAMVYCAPSLRPTASAGEAKDELRRFAEAREALARQLQERAKENEIFAAHAALAKDILLQERVALKINEQAMTAQQAVWEAVEEFAKSVEAVADAYLRERAADIRDVGKGYLALLQGAAQPDFGALRAPAVVVAEGLYPSDIAGMDPALVQGIITEQGGPTGHAFLLARALGIPMLVGAKGICARVKAGELICMDAAAGEIVLRPDEETLADYRKRKEEIQKIARRPTAPATKSEDGVHLFANAGGLKEIEEARSLGIAGIGLFRSELLFMQLDRFPTEEEQLAVYAKAAALAGGEVTIRALDIGGEKALPYDPYIKEENPLLGKRGIRLLLERRALFKTQLRAVLRAGAAGKVRLLLPMLVSLEELREAKALLAACRKELKSEGLAFAENMPVGIMVETPAAVLLAAEFAREADFFCIGANDLTQYMLAADRRDPALACKYNCFHPAVLRAMESVLAAGKEAGIRVCLCGEMAADERATALLLSMGLTEFSVPVENIETIRRQLCAAAKEKTP